MGNDIFTFKFSNPSKPSGILGYIPWVLVGILSITVLVMGYLLATQKPIQPAAAWQVPRLGQDVIYSDIANKANTFITNLMSFTSSGFSENLKNIKDVCTPEYMEPLRYVIEDPGLADLIRKKQITASTEIDPPKILKIEEGKVHVFVSGKIIMSSPITNQEKNTWYYKATLIFVRHDNHYKISNAIWKIYDPGAQQ
jgi:hypothetical protein